uniref:Amine oxidase domain-containing protein n=1 Tax=Physcomitrium patens TaxID=3218 RepID=A0A7I4AX58_PHYPA
MIVLTMARLLRKFEAPARGVLCRSCFSESRRYVTDAKVHGTGFLTERVWDAVIVGGGHNGLTAAAYLARAGLQVAVLERRHVLGGAAVTEEIVPGFKFSRASYLQSLLRPGIIQELDLTRHGLKLLPRNPSSFTPTVDGRFLLMGPDSKLNEAEISKFSKHDAAAYPKYEHMLEKFCSVMDPLLDTVPPEAAMGGTSLAGRMADGWSKSKVLGSLLKRSSKLKQHEITSFMELLLAPASKVLNNWFESDVLKATLATDAVIGAMASVHTPGSGYVLLHHVMGETNGSRGIWSYVQGGMGAVSTAIAKAASEAGATLATNVEANQFLMDSESRVGKEIAGVILVDGSEVRAKQVLSNATPAVTFLKLMPESVLDEEFLTSVKSIDYKSGTTKINIAVDRLPMFRACSRTDNTAGPEHCGTIHLGADCMDEIDIAYREALLGRASSRPLIEMTIPSVLDETIAPPGCLCKDMF